MRMPKDLLHAALVLSRKPHARIVHVDLSTAEQVSGYVNYFGYQDVPGTNLIGPIVHDEECFAEKEVTCVGQVPFEANSRMRQSGSCVICLICSH